MTIFASDYRPKCACGGALARCAVTVLCILTLFEGGPAGASSSSIFPAQLAEQEDWIAHKIEPVPVRPRTEVSKRKVRSSTRQPGEEIQRESQSPSVFRVAIAPSNSQPAGLFPEPGRITAQGLVWKGLITLAYQTPFHRVISRVPDPAGTYDVSIVVPQDREDLLYLLFQQTVAKALGVRLHRETCEMDVFVLRVQEGKPNKLRRSRAEKTQHWFDQGKINGVKQSMSAVAEVLEDLLDRPVVDETALEGDYDWEMSYKRADEASVIGAIEDDLGLEVVPARRPVEVLIVEAEVTSEVTADELEGTVDK